MKVTQIVGEHKKGYRANIYRKKKVIAPQSTEIKPMEEDAKITRSDTSGVEITADTGIKTVLPADKATALAPDPQNPNEYDLNPAAVNPSASGTAGTDGPKVGDSVEMKTAEDGTSPRFMGYQKTKHDNGDTTDDYSQGPMAVKVRKDAKGNTVSSDAQYNIGPDQVQMNRNQVGVNTLTAQGPNADNIVSANASAQRKGVDPAKFAAFQKQNPNAVREDRSADDRLLDQMLTIAKLR